MVPFPNGDAETLDQMYRTLQQSSMPSQPSTASTFAPPQSSTNFSSIPPSTHSSAPDDIASFLGEMPQLTDDAARNTLWTEMIKLKSKSLELQIAEARRKEREAELELMRLKQQETRRLSMTEKDRPQPLAIGGFAQATDYSGYPAYDFQAALPAPSFPPSSLPEVPPQPALPLYPPPPQQAQSAALLSSFDLETMLQNSDTDNPFAWLTEMGDGFSYPDPFGSNAVTSPSNQMHPPTPSNGSGIKRRSLSASSDRSPEPTQKKTKKNPAKKIVVERPSNCMMCRKSIARILLRAPKSQIPDPVEIAFKCLDCVPVVTPANKVEMSKNASGIISVDTRKRMRAALEAEEHDKERKCFCDVCQRIIASGEILGGPLKQSLAHIAEVICNSCDSKYSRCTDCGGGGGPRVGIGKWRSKGVFQPGRKTCGLSHSRIGDRPREIGVYVTPTDFNEDQLKEVLNRCKALWQEKTLSRLAVPEVLEIETPPNRVNPVRSYADIEAIINGNWSNRERMILADGTNPNRFKRLLGLTWAHSRPRRNVRTVDIEDGWTGEQKNDDENDDMSTVLANVRRTNVVIPPGSDLISMWTGEWDMNNGSLLVSTAVHFERTDGEDHTAVSVGEMISKVQNLRAGMNEKRRILAEREGKEPETVPPCEHLWVVSTGNLPLTKERLVDVLIAKRSFVLLEEYLTRHPDFINSVRERPYGLHPDGLGNEMLKTPTILVRWLGRDFDTKKILEIKQAEFGGKGKAKKKAKAE
ncbi:hypothetical protein P7C73_g4917, partial [Tremellales sp. Uapishka_1]